jgi:hypothetical protein
MRQITRKAIEKTLAQYEIKPGGKEFMAGAILLAGLNVGPNVKRVAKVLKVSRKEVQPYAQRLRQSKIWSGGKINCGWFEKETSGISFLLDLSVAMGFLQRA